MGAEVKGDQAILFHISIFRLLDPFAVRMKAFRKGGKIATRSIPSIRSVLQ